MPLARALGRPIRDQVFTTRNTTATMLQALELVNGETTVALAASRRAKHARRTAAAAGGLFVTPMNARGAAAGQPRRGPRPRRSTSACRARPGSGSSCRTRIDRCRQGGGRLGGRGTDRADGGDATGTLAPLDATGVALGVRHGGHRRAGLPGGGARKTPSRLVYDISGRGFTGSVAWRASNTSRLAQGETILGRFLIFGTEPDMDRLVPPAPETPLPPVRG